MKQLTTCSGDTTLLDDDIYELVSGDFWHYDGSRVFKGKSAGRADTLHSFVKGKAPIGYVIDHADRNPLNNQRSNLRYATYSENSYNTSPRRNINKSSKYKGVTRYGNKYRAVIQYDGDKIHLGYFHSEVEAAIAYNVRAKELFKEFAYLNDVGEK